jgi:hypothetical protein
MKYKLPLFYDYVFPNIVLPNALITEFGMINYLHSLYSNKMRHNNGFFDPTEIVNPCSLIFNNELGSWPNSSGGCHLNHEFYTNCLELNENSLYFGKKTTSKYIYPIKISPHIDDFIGVNLPSGSKLNGEYFWKHMSAEALQDVRQQKSIIFLDYAEENFIERVSYVNLHEALKNSGIPKEQIILAFNSFNAQEVYESWFPEAERKLEVRNWPFVISATSYHYDKIDEKMTALRFLSTTNRIRSKYFLFKIRRPRLHRIGLLYRLVTDGLLDKCDWSCLTSLEYNEAATNHIATHYRCRLDKELIQNLHSQLPHSLISEVDSDYTNVSAWTDKNIAPYMDSYFYVCTETYIHGEHKSLTEKVFKPIANFQPFLFLAYPGALKVLKNLGFRTFDNFIDESYDDEIDESVRSNMIYQEITRLCSMSVEEIHSWYWSMKDILIHNYYHLLNIHKTETWSVELIKYLHGRVSL